MSLMIVFVQEGVTSCTKTVIRAAQAPLQNGTRVPALVHGSQLCASAGESTQMHRIITMYPCALKMMQHSATKWLAALRGILFLEDEAHIMLNYLCE